MSTFRSLTACAVTMLAVIGAGQGAQAATETVDFSGSILWGTGTGSFNFDVGSTETIGTTYNLTASSASPDTYSLYTPATNSSSTYAIDTIRFNSASSFSLGLSDGQNLTINSVTGNFASVLSGILTISTSNGYLATASITSPAKSSDFAPFAVSVSAVPLPAAMPMFVAGLAGLGFIAWRRKTV